LVETLSALFTLGIYLKYTLCFTFFVYAVLGYSLIVITFIDLKWKVIPDIITLPGILLGIILSFVLPQVTFKESALGAIMGGGTLYIISLGYYILKKREGMGGGDIKLLAMIGCIFGMEGHIAYYIFILTPWHYSWLNHYGMEEKRALSSYPIWSILVIRYLNYPI